MEMKKIMTKLALGTALACIGFFAPLPQYVCLAFVIAGYLVVGSDVLISAVQNLLRGNALDENFLMSIATIGAFVLGEPHEAVFVMVFYQIGEAFQHYAVGKSRQSISHLMDIRPEYATLLKEGKEKKVDPSNVEVGEEIIVKAGEKIPLDGVIVSGTGALDTRALTGETLPEDVKTGDMVFSGTLSINGVLIIKTTKTYNDSTVAKILDLVENASSRKSKMEKFITKFARYYTPSVVLGALLLAVVPPLFFGQAFSEWFYRGLSFLVISCPCALVISIPLGFFGGIAGAAKHGILVKGSNYLQVLSHAQTMVFDKTGTLTKGQFAIKEIVPKGEITAETLLHMAAIAESESTHPIAQSIKQAYGKHVSMPENINEKSGHGMHVTHEGKEIYAGNDKLMEDISLPYEKVEKSGSVVHVAVDGKYYGYILVADAMKEQTPLAIERLKKAGIAKTVMLTGDRENIAKEIAKEAGIDQVYSQLLPTDKVTLLEQEMKMQKPHTTLVYVGDGINDAPVLARADVGIAMGAMGSQAAIEAADIVIMNDDLMNIKTAVDISNKTMRIVKENIVISLAIKAVVLMLATFGISGLWAAIFADVGVAVLAILNAMRAMYFKGEKE